jgi:predicted permease
MILRELRNAWRRWCRRPGYAALSIAVLGVGLGVVLFLFSLVNTLMLQPLPFPQPGRLVAIGELRDGSGGPGDSGSGIGAIDSEQYRLLHEGLGGVDRIGGYATVGISVDAGAGATQYEGGMLTASMMDLLGVRPLLGHGFTPADDSPGAAPALLLGETLWRRVFDADPKIVGRSVRVNGEWATVVGVLPAEFGFPGTSQVWLPLRPDAAHPPSDIYMVARLKAGTTLNPARQALAALDARLRLQSSHWRNQQRIVMKPLALGLVPESLRRWVWLMFGAGVLVLLLACVNVANLQLVQTLNRRRELALRSALGSTRARLMSGALAESLLLSAAALAVALPVVYFGNRWLVAMYAAHGQAPSSTLHFGIDVSVLVFAVLAALVSTALAGVVPAWRASRTDLQDALRDGSKGSSGGFTRMAKVLVVAEIVLTVVLLVGAGTFVRALDGLLTQPTVGASHATQVLTAHVALPPVSYPRDEQRIHFLESVAARLRQDPGVLDVTAANTVPGAELGSHEEIAAQGQSRPAEGWQQAQMGIVDAHFLDTYGVRLMAGRFFDARDRADSLPVTVVDRKTAAALWPGRDALGQHLVMYPDEAYAQTMTVVGVIEPLQMDSELNKPLPGLLLPLPQSAGASPLRSVGLAVRTRGDARGFASSLITAVRSVDTQAAVYRVRTQSGSMEAGRVGLRVLTEVFSALGLVALLLAAAGLYGVLAFSVEQRTREIGVRRAIGAGHGAILRNVGRQLLWQLGLGLGGGLLLAWPWSGLLADPGLHTRGHDPAVFLPVLLLVLLVTVLAALVPLLRALRVDPAIALRYE